VRQPASGATGLADRAGAAVRLLPVRPDHGDGGLSQEQSESDRRRHRRQSHQYLPLWHLRAASSCGASRRRPDARVREGAMTDTNLSRRQFVTTALTAAGGFALGVGLLDPAQAASLSV